MEGLSVASAIAAVNLVYFWKIWTGAAAFWYRDSVIGFLPTKLYLRERLLSGEWPLWIDRVKNGMPFWGDPVNAVLYPGHALLLLFRDPLYAYGLLVIVHFALAHGGFYLWLRSLDLGRAGAFLGALSVAYCGVFVQKHENVQFLFAWAWLGWYFTALNRYLRAPGWGWGALVVAALYLPTTSGDIQTIYIAGGLSVVLALLEARKHREFRYRLGGTLWLLTTTALLASPFLLPVYELSTRTTRLASGTLEAVTQWSFHPFRWTEWFVPELYGFTFREDMPFWAKSLARTDYIGFYTPQSYFGILLIPLALLGLWKSRNSRSIRLWTVTGLFFFVAACGTWTPLYGVLYKVLPFWANFRFPERLLIWVMMALAVMAAHGLDWFRSDRSADDGRPFPVVIPAFMVLVTVVLWEIGGQTDLIDPWLRDIRGADLSPELFNLIGRALQKAALLWAAGTVVMVLIAISRWKAAAWAAVLFTAIELFRVTVPMAPVWDSNNYRTPPSLIGRFLTDFPAEANPEGVPARLFFNHESGKIHWAGEETEAVSRQIWNLVYGNLILLTPYSSPIGYNSSELTTMTRMLHGAQWRNYLALTGGNYWLVLPQTAEKRTDWTCGKPDSVLNLVWCTDALQTGPARCPANWTRFEDPKSLASAYRITDFKNRRDYALIGSFDAADNSNISPAVQSGSGSAASICDPLIWDEDHRVVRVEHTNEGPVIIRDNYYPGWKAYAEGKELPVFPANGGQIAAWVPSGRQDVEFRFEPGSLRIGVLLAALGFFMNWVAAWRYRPRAPSLDISEKAP